MKKLFRIAFIFLMLGLLPFCEQKEYDVLYERTFQSFDVDFQIWEIEAEQGGEFALANGTVIKIPSKAFIDENKKLVEGKVKVYYREVHSISEWLATGIPAWQDSAGVRQPLQTDGMFEIRAFQNGKALGVAPKQHIRVNMASFKGYEDFNAFQLDEPSNYAQSLPFINPVYAQNLPITWKYMGKSYLLHNPLKKQKLDSVAQLIYTKILAKFAQTSTPYPSSKRLPPPMTAAPKSDKNNFFKVKIAKKNPLFDTFQKTWWESLAQLDVQNPQAEGNEWVLDEVWDDIKIQPADMRLPILTLQAYKDANGKQKGHQANISSVAFAPNNHFVLTGSEDQTARLWNLSGEELQVFPHGDKVNTVAFSPDGRKILTAGDNKIIKLWTLSGRKVGEIKGHNAAITSVDFSADGSKILTGSKDSTARVWDLAGKELMKFKMIVGGTTVLKEEYAISSIAFSPDSKYVLTGSPDWKARLWDSSGKIIKTFFHKGKISSAVFSPNGKYILTCGKNTVKIWDLAGKEIQSLQYREELKSAVFSPDSRYILSTGSDSVARIRSLSGQLFTDLRRHQNSIVTGRFSPNGNLVATASLDRKVNIYDLSLGHQDADAMVVRFYKKMTENKSARQFISILRKVSKNQETVGKNQEATTKPVFRSLENLISEYSNLVLFLPNLQRESIEKERIAALSLEKSHLDEVADFYRPFLVPRLGVYACFKDLNGKAAFHHSEIHSEKMPKNAKLFLFIRHDQENSLVQVLPNSHVDICYNTDYENILIAVFEDDQVHICRLSDEYMERNIKFEPVGVIDDLAKLKEFLSSL